MWVYMNSEDRLYSLDADATHTQAGLYEWLRRCEAVLVLAYLIHGESTPKTRTTSRHRRCWRESGKRGREKGRRSKHAKCAWQGRRRRTRITIEDTGDR